MNRLFNFTKARLLMDEFDSYARPFEAHIRKQDGKFLVERASSYGGMARLESFENEVEAEAFLAEWQARFPETEKELNRWFDQQWQKIFKP